MIGLENMSLKTLKDDDQYLHQIIKKELVQLMDP